MDAQEYERLSAWFADKWKHKECPVCETDFWSPTPNLGQIENLDNIGGRVPVLLITCRNCGYFLSVNALVAGIRQVPRFEAPTSNEDASTNDPAEASG